jgi:hypothetical protein
VGRRSRAENFIYGIVAGGAVLAAGSGLYLVAQFVGHWALFEAGIAKLLH